ncbi:MAG: hypothetical protein HC882_00320 [Acidobacteria bacterium]|nr:hypothetical protein [Acidobacteriota bacterium]
MYRAQVVASLRQAIESDAAMWALDTRLAYRWQPNAVCMPRGQAARVWRPDGPCNLGRIDCNWGMWVLDETCNRSVFTEHMFQYPRYVWAQGKLSYLLGAGRPPGYPTAATADRWARWVFDVLQLVSVAYWSTNVRANGPGIMGPSRVDNTPYLNTKGLAWENFEVLVGRAFRVQYPGATMPTLRSPDGRAMALAVDMRLWNQFSLNNGSGWQRGPDGQPLLVPPDLPRSRVSFDPVVLVTTHGPDGRGMESWPVGISRVAHNAPLLEKLTVYMRETARLAERQMWLRTRQQGDRRGTGAMEDVYWPTAEFIVAQVEAMARDIIDRSMGTILAEGLQRWNDALSMLPGDYRTALFGSLNQYQEFSRAITNSNMDMMLGGIQAGTAIIGAVAGAVNAGAGAIIAIYSALLQGFHEILKATDSYATGAGAIPPCPPIPMVRTMAQSQCNFELVGTDGTAFAVRPDTYDPAPTSDPPPLAPPSVKKGSSGPAILGGAALLALLFSMRK